MNGTRMRSDHHRRSARGVGSVGERALHSPHRSNRFGLRETSRDRERGHIRRQHRARQRQAERALVVMLDDGGRGIAARIGKADSCHLPGVWRRGPDDVNWRDLADQQERQQRSVQPGQPGSHAAGHQRRVLINGRGLRWHGEWVKSYTARPANASVPQPNAGGTSCPQT